MDRQRLSPDDSDQPIPIYTVGYGERSLDAFIEVLRAYDVGYLIDIRSAPYSRYKPEFSKRTLEDALRRHGIRYVFMGRTLGGRPTDPECYSGEKVDYEKVKRKDFYQEGIERIRNAFKQQQCIVLMCSEGKPEHCHRSKLIGETLTELEIPVRHIDEKGELKSQTEVINILTGGQLSLFGRHTFTSSKRYSTEESADDA